MKKRFLSLAMALVFCLSLMPISAAAYSEESYELWIAGTQVTSTNADDVLGDGKVSYDATSNTLSLNGASITNAGADLAVTAYNNRGVVYAGSEDLTVTLTGDNTITATNVTDGYDVDGFYSSIGGTKVTFDGTGSLAIYADSTTGRSNSAGVYLNGPSEIAAGTTVTASSASTESGFSCGYYACGGVLTVNGTLSGCGSSSAHFNSFGVFAGGIVVNEGAVLRGQALSGDCSTGVYSSGNGTDGLTVNGGTVNAIGGSGKTSSYGIESSNNDPNGENRGVVIHGGTVLAVGGTAQAAEMTVSSAGIRSYTSMVVDGDAQVTAVADTATNDGYYGSGSAMSDGIKVGMQYYAPTITIGGTATVTAIAGTATPDRNGYSSSQGIFATDVTINDEATVIASGGEAAYYSYGIQCQAVEGRNITINGGTVTATGNISALSQAPVLGDGVTAGGSASLDGSGAVIYSADDNSSYKWFHTPFESYTVTVIPGANMILDNEDVSLTQTVPAGTAMEEICFIPEDGYCFPEDYASLGTVSGIAVALDTGDIIISGTPTADVTITLADTSPEEAPPTPPAPPAPGGSTGRAGSPIPCPVTVDESDNGAVSAEPKKAAPGETVTLTVVPEEGYVLAELTVTDEDGNPLTVTEEDGKYTFSMPDSPVTVTASFVPAGQPAYSDVPEDAWYADAVDYVTEEGWMEGIGNGLFDPDSTMTRAMFATVLYRMAGRPAVTGANPFSDVEEGKWYSDAVCWAAQEGILRGYGNGKFGIADAITREQAVTVLWRLAGMPAAQSVSTGASAWAQDAMSWAADVDLLPDDSDRPQEPATRAELAHLLYAFALLEK